MFQGKHVPNEQNNLFYVDGHLSTKQINVTDPVEKRKWEPKLIANRSGLEPCFVHGPGNTDLDFIVGLYRFKAHTKQQRRSGWYYMLSCFRTQVHCFTFEIVLVCVILMVLISTVVIGLKWKCWKRTKKQKEQEQQRLPLLSKPTNNK